MGELARHWMAAQPIDLTKAISYSQQAGDAALSALAPADALRYYAQALDLYTQIADPDPVRGLDLAIGLGTAQRQTGDPTYHDTLLAAARQAIDLGETKRLVAAALANDRGYTSNSNATDTDKVDVLEMALDRLPADDPDRALVLATLCSELSSGSPLERLQALADEALAIAESKGDDATIVRVLNQVILPSLVPSLLEQTLARTADALVRAERLGDPVLLFFAAHSRASAVFLAGDIDEMDRCIEIMGSLAEQLDQPILSWTNTFHLSKRAQIAGDTDLAEQLATEALQIGTDCGQPDAALFFGAQLLVVCAQRGTMGELIPLIEQMVDESSALAGVLTQYWLRPTQKPIAPRTPGICWRSSLPPTSISLWTKGGSQGCTAMPKPPSIAGTQSTPDRSSTGSLLGPSSRSLPVVSRRQAWLVTPSVVSLLSSRRYDEADAYFTQSSASSARMKAKFYGAITDLLWGCMLGRTPGRGRHRQGSGPSDKGAHCGNGQRVQERGAPRCRGHPRPELNSHVPPSSDPQY